LICEITIYKIKKKKKKIIIIIIRIILLYIASQITYFVLIQFSYAFFFKIFYEAKYPKIRNLRDGNKKMSKSDLSDNSRINLTDKPEVIYEKIMRAKTDVIAKVELFFLFNFTHKKIFNSFFITLILF